MISVERSIILSILMIFTFFYIQFMDNGQTISPLKPFSTFPKEIAEWTGIEDFFSPRVYKAVGVDDSVLIYYSNKKNQNIQLYLGYYRSQREGDLIHSPKNCMVGSGWEIIETSLESVDIAPGKKINIIKLILEKNAQKQVVLYWFHSRGRIINSEYKQKIYLVIDSIFRNRTDGSFVRFISPAGSDYDDTIKYMKKFIIAFFPYLNEYIAQ